jgi:flagellar basal-body rod protein FlgB
MAMLKSRLQFHQARQKLLAENVANADSPGYRPRDLRPFEAQLAAKGRGLDEGLLRTDPRHLGGPGASGGLGSRRASLFESTPSGNAVNLEDEMMRIAQNQGDYQLATSLYSKSLSLLRTAVGRR